MVRLPVATPVTTPVVFTEAIAALLVLHTPPETPSVRVVFAPVQSVAAPDIVPAKTPVFTFTVVVAVPVPQLLVTV